MPGPSLHNLSCACLVTPLLIFLILNAEIVSVQNTEYENTPGNVVNSVIIVDSGVELPWYRRVCAGV